MTTLHGLLLSLESPREFVIVDFERNHASGIPEHDVRTLSVSLAHLNAGHGCRTPCSNGFRNRWSPERVSAQSSDLVPKLVPKIPN